MKFLHLCTVSAAKHRVITVVGSFGTDSNLNCYGDKSTR